MLTMGLYRSRSVHGEAVSWSLLGLVIVCVCTASGVWCIGYLNIYWTAFLYELFTNTILYSLAEIDLYNMSCMFLIACLDQAAMLARSINSWVYMYV